MTNESYGKSPVEVGTFDLKAEFNEFMTYQYLPVMMPQGYTWQLEKRIEFLQPMLQAAEDDFYDLLAAQGRIHELTDCYIYLTAKHGFATPGNPLNRPGWHCDDFGGEDINYVWADAFPTDFLIAKRPLNIPSEDAASMTRMEEIAWVAREGKSDPNYNARIVNYPDNLLLRIDPYVIHTTAEIPAPGGLRSFVKISFSKNKFNLKGNSHNYLIDYKWEMHDRKVVRNLENNQRNLDYVK